MTSNEWSAGLHAARRAEKEQALFYRALAAQAEERGDGALSERLNDLHADEQHHLSRLTARLLERGEALEDLADVRAPAVAVEGWEAVAREREEEEVRRYDALLRVATGDDAGLLREIAETERHHAEELGGKWTRA